MIRKVVAALVLVPLAVVAVLVAVANRHAVTVALDPSGTAPALAVTAPLFAILFGALIAGVVVGGTAAWLRQRRHRRAARRAEAEVRALRAETEALKQRLEAAERAAAALGSPIVRRPPAA